MPNASDYHKDFPVSWEALHRDVQALAWRLAEKGPWQGIVAVTRGGLVPACIVARELGILTIETCCISSYRNKDQQEISILKKPDLKSGGKGWIVVDDLADTGTTFKLARTHFPDAHYACVYVKPQGAPLADTFVTEVSQDTWIHFPWETETSREADSRL